MTFEQRPRKILGKRTFIVEATATAKSLRFECRRPVGGGERSLADWSSISK